MSTETIKPEFLKKLDNYLLTHFPVIWQTRIIWVAFYSLALFGLFFMFGDYFDYEPLEHYDYKYRYYYGENNDLTIFGVIPMFLSVLMLFYWLYVQFQQKIDYSKLSMGDFMSTVFLNFMCVGLIFLPVTGLVMSTLDLGNAQESAFEMLQRIMTVAMAATVLPFVIRHHSLIEMVLTLFFGFVYCLGVIMLFAGVMEIRESEAIVGFLIFNYFVFLGYVLVKFANRTYTQNTKRLALLCLMALPLVIPAFVSYLGFHGWRSIEYSYQYTLGFKGREFSSLWVVSSVGVVMTIYSLLAYFMYRAMLFPIRRK